MFLQPAVHATKLRSSETILQGLGCDCGLALGLFSWSVLIPGKKYCNEAKH